MAQSAALIGMTGLTFMIVLWASLPALLARRPRHWLGWAGTVLALLALPAAYIYGALRLGAATDAAVPGVVVRIVQPNTEQSAKWRGENARPIFEKLLRMSAEPAGALGQPTHIVWPESAVPFLLAEETKAHAMIAEWIPGEPVLITGSLKRDRSITEDDGTARIYNSVMVFDGKAKLIAVYDKWRLVPGGEFLPFEWLLGPLGFRRVVTVPGSFGAGPGPVTMPIPGAGRASFLICYEAIFPHDLIDTDAPPDFLINVTNDGWFGQTSGPYQHLAQARLRSIEQGLPMIRAANTGISAVIDGYGRVLSTFPLGDEGIVDARLPVRLRITPYGNIRDCGTVFLILLGLASGLVSRRSELT